MTELRLTGDGSSTLYSEKFAETYHSVNGAITESTHVFIEAGLNFCPKKVIRLFEVGFGTGLNAFLACCYAKNKEVKIHYHAVEKYPVDDLTACQMQLPGYTNDEIELFRRMHLAEWDQEMEINPWFSLKKIHRSFEEISFQESYDVVFFDAFSPVTQPELWTLSVFERIFKSLSLGGILTTYCAKGEVRRNLKAVGFEVERLPGPPGKREMLRAVKRSSDSNRSENI